MRYTVLALFPPRVVDLSRPTFPARAEAFLVWVFERYGSKGDQVKLVIWGQSIGAGVGTTAAAHHFDSEASGMRGLGLSGLILVSFTSVRDMLVTALLATWLPTATCGRSCGIGGIAGRQRAQCESRRRERCQDTDPLGWKRRACGCRAWFGVGGDLQRQRRGRCGEGRLLGAPHHCLTKRGSGAECCCQLFGRYRTEVMLSEVRTHQ